MGITGPGIKRIILKIRSTIILWDEMRRHRGVSVAHGECNRQGKSDDARKDEAPGHVAIVPNHRAEGGLPMAASDAGGGIPVHHSPDHNYTGKDKKESSNH